MTRFVAVSNRRGGVGKTTVTMMLSYGLSVIGQQRVLVIDLDPQSSTSAVLIGGERLREARRATDERGRIGCTVANLMSEMYGSDKVDASSYIITHAGDVAGSQGRIPHLHIIPGSYDLDDREIELILARSSKVPALSSLFDQVQRRVGEIIRSVSGAYDYVIVDCAPGLSQVVWGALRTVDYVIVPYVPDQTAQDNVAWFCGKLNALSRAQVRTLPNRAGNNNQGIVESINGEFESLPVRIPQSAPLSNALDYRFERCTLAQKFGAANSHVTQLTDAFFRWVSK